MNVPNTTTSLHFRISRDGTTYTVESSTNGVEWMQMRLFRLMEDIGLEDVEVGMYCCSPKDSRDFKVEFKKFEIVRS